MNKMAANNQQSTMTWFIPLVFFALTLSSVAFTNGQSFSRTSAEICGLENFDVENLTNAKEGWSYEYKFNGTGDNVCLDNSETCKFVFVFCSQINCSVYQNASACLLNLNSSDDITEEFKLATYSTQNLFLPGSSGISFQANYTNGENITNSQKAACNLSVIAEFDCNAKAVWTEPKKEIHSIIPPQALTKIAYDKDKCQYSFKFDYAGACQRIAPIPSDVVPAIEPLSTGTILIIIFFVTILTYFIFGMGCNCALGRRGKEVIPQSEFWTMLPVYIADGCLFTCRCGKTEDSTATKYDSI